MPRSLAALVPFCDLIVKKLKSMGGSSRGMTQTPLE